MKAPFRCEPVFLWNCSCSGQPTQHLPTPVMHSVKIIPTYRCAFAAVALAVGVMTAPTAPGAAVVHREQQTFQTFTITGDLADAEASSTNVGDGNGNVNAGSIVKNTTILAGAFNTSLVSPVFVFMLPTLELGETIVEANLDLSVLKFGGVFPTGNVLFNGDLYGLGFRINPDVLGSDYFTGNADTSNATLIQRDFLTDTNTTATAATISTSAAADTALANYVQAQYAAGAIGGNYVFLRVSPDFQFAPTGVTGERGYRITPADSSVAADRPEITLVSVPEPTSAVLLITGVVACLARRRRSAF